MPYYRLLPIIPENGTFLTTSGNPWAMYKTGHMMEDFTPPMQCHLSEDFKNGHLQTFYTTPAFIGTKQFYRDLTDCGIDSIEAFPVLVEDQGNDRVIEDYLLLNVLGRVSCADMDESEYFELIPGFQMIDELVIKKGSARDRYLFLAHEDTNCIVVAEHVKKHLESKGYTDIQYIEIPEV